MDIGKLYEAVANDESLLFDGCYSERIIRADLSTRRGKRNFYVESYNKFIDGQRLFIRLAQQAQDAALVERIEKCKKESSRLLDIVFEY